MKKDISYLQKTMASTSGIIIFIMLISIAAAAPAIPHAFSGTAQINGRPVPTGSVITAEVDGVVKGSVTLSEVGTWGFGGTADKLIVQSVQNGDEIVFYVQTLQMTNKIQASETAIFQSGGLDEITLTFNGEEIAKQTTSGGSGGSSGGSGGSGGSGPQIEEPEEPEAQPVQGSSHDLDLSGNEPVEIELDNKDTVNILIDDASYSVFLKSMSDFSILLDYEGENIIIGVEESKEIDLNGDYVGDVSVYLNGIDNDRATLTFAKLEKGMVEAGFEGLTGYATANPVPLGIFVIIVLGLLGASIYTFKRRGF